MTGMRYINIYLTSRKQKRMGPVGCFGQIENNKRQSLVISSSQSNIQTTLRTIEPYRLKALVMEDLKFHPNSSVQEISSRLPDVDFKRLQDLVRKMARALNFFLKIVAENRKEYWKTKRKKRLSGWYSGLPFLVFNKWRITSDKSLIPKGVTHHQSNHL